MRSLTFFALCAFFLFHSCSKDASVGEAASQTGVSGSITRFAVYQGYLYGLNLNEVQTYSLADPNKPVLVNKLRTEYGLETITIYDSVMYVGASDALYILDLTKPSEPALLSRTERIGGFSGCDPVVVKGNYAYSTVKILRNFCGIISATSALIVWNVKDKTNPVQVSGLDLGVPNGLAIVGDYLLICDEGTDRVEVVDISKPNNPILMPFGIPLTDPVDLIVNGQKAIISTKTSFDIYDISNLEVTRKLASIKK
jgi:hypothetical protein